MDTPYTFYYKDKTHKSQSPWNRKNLMYYMLSLNSNNNNYTECNHCNTCDHSNECERNNECNNSSRCDHSNGCEHSKERNESNECEFYRNEKQFGYDVKEIYVNQQHLTLNRSACLCSKAEADNDHKQVKITTPSRSDIVEQDKPKSPICVIPRMDWENYHRLNVIYNFMDELEQDFPAVCTVGKIGTSLEGRDIKILKVSNSNASNPSVWMDAGIHAREWIAPAVATYIADQIVRNFTSLPCSMQNKDWFFLPVVNPDGYEYSHTIDRMWRKNRAWHGGRCVGVDLNRNFSYGWGESGSSEIPTHNFYRGPEPFSEPESTAMKDFILNSGTSFTVYITLHSYGQVILFPFAYKDQLCRDYVRLLQGATVMSKAIFECNGNIYKVGISRDVMYGAAGTSNDWSYGQARIPYCYLIELRSKKHKFKLPKEEIEETGNEILNCVKALMDFIDGNNVSSSTRSE